MTDSSSHASGFRAFLIDQKVIGIATGLAVGGAASALATSFINNIIMVPVGYFFGSTDGLKGLSWDLGVRHGQEMIWNYGAFLGSLVDFIVIALVFYLVIKYFKLDKTS